MRRKIFAAVLLSVSLAGAERIQPGTPKWDRSKTFLVAGAAADLASSYYVTRTLERRGVVVYERHPFYGSRFDARDVAIGAGIVAGVLLVEHLTPGWKHWRRVNWVLGSVRFGAAAHNLTLLRTAEASRIQAGTGVAVCPCCHKPDGEGR